MLMTEYLILINDLPIDENLIGFVVAQNEEEALDAYVNKLGIHEYMFLEHVYSQAINDGFCEHFFRDEKGYFLDEYGKYKKHLNDEYIEETFVSNVKKFFKNHDAFAEKYLDMYYNSDFVFEEDRKNIPRRYEFSEEMLEYIYKEYYLEESMTEIRILTLSKYRI